MQSRLEVFKIHLYADNVNIRDYCDILIFVINQLDAQTLVL
jgi:hypothetical protein